MLTQDHPVRQTSRSTRKAARFRQPSSIMEFGRGDDLGQASSDRSIPPKLHDHDPGESGAAGSDAAGSDAAGSDAAGSDTAGSDTAGSDTAGSHTAGSDAAGSDT